MNVADLDLFEVTPGWSYPMAMGNFERLFVSIFPQTLLLMAMIS